MTSNSPVKFKKAKKKLAPQAKKLKVDDLKVGFDLKKDEFEFSDDMLAEVFDDKSETSQNIDLCGTIDLDDWIPTKLKEHQLLVSKKEKSSIVPSITPLSLPVTNGTTYPKKVLNKSLNFTNRKQCMFNSKEYDEDSTLRLRFLKRDIPTAHMKEMISTLEMVPLLEALKFSGKNWFTYGVVSDRGELRKGGSGRIDVTDLSSEPYILRFLLFNTAYDSVSKIAAGTIVCLLNPTKAKPYNGKEALVLNDSAQILITGTSRDFGLCSGKKKGGGACHAVVNMNICRYCKYHAITEYKQQKVAKDLKAAAAGVGLGNNNRHRAGLWNAQASQASSLNPAKKNLIQINKDKERLKKLDASSTSSTPIAENKNTLPSSPVIGTWPKFDPASLLASSIPSAEKRKSSCMSDSNESSSLHQDKRNIQVQNQSPSTSSASLKMSLAKRKALQYARETGGIAKEKPKQKLEEVCEDKKKGPQGITEEFLAAMREKPRDAALLESAEAVERDKRFERLKIVEEISEKLVATHEVPVRAIRCLVCKKNFHQMPLQCVMNKHNCRVVTGTKRFYECNSCRARTTTLERFPAAECSKCGVWSWKKAGIAAEKVCTPSNQLCVRGLEEKFMGSVVNDPNLSLLVPENVS